MQTPVTAKNKMTLGPGFHNFLLWVQKKNAESCQWSSGSVPTYVINYNQLSADNCYQP